MCWAQICSHVRIIKNLKHYHEHSCSSCHVSRCYTSSETLTARSRLNITSCQEMASEDEVPVTAVSLPHILRALLYALFNDATIKLHFQPPAQEYDVKPHFLFPPTPIYPFCALGTTSQDKVSIGISYKAMPPSCMGERPVEADTTELFPRSLQVDLWSAIFPTHPATKSNVCFRS